VGERPSSITYDPSDPNTFWESGIYNGGGVYETTDNGNSFKQLGNLVHTDFVSVDLGDPARRTLLSGKHERSNLYRSGDGGATWVDLSSTLPTGIGFTTSPLVVNANLFLLGTKGVPTSGIFRSTSAGATWSKVYPGGVAGPALVAKSDGAIYWLLDNGNGVIKSTDQWLTWHTVVGPGQISQSSASLIELPNGRLATFGSSILVSADHGVTWQPFGPTLPYSPTGIVYAPSRKAFYAWRFDCNSGGTPPSSPMRSCAWTTTTRRNSRRRFGWVPAARNSARTMDTSLSVMLFATDITVTGPMRSPAQMLADQKVDGHSSVHDGAAAASMGLIGAPIEGPTHFSQFDPLAVALWGQVWFERGCISSHFRTMVVEGEEVQASLTTKGRRAARIEAHKSDGTPVLVGTASIGPDDPDTELDARLAARGDPGELFIIDQLEVGMRRDDGEVASISYVEGNGSAYPFSLADKLGRITEPHPWYTPEGGSSSPWGRAVVPMEMISVLANKSGTGWPVRSPALGLFLDLEIRLIAGPVFVQQEYTVAREIVGLSQSRRTESYWTRTTLSDVDTAQPVAAVLLHSGVFKESYPGYPKERLS
jgi:hypothetical protein